MLTLDFPPDSGSFNQGASSFSQSSNFRWPKENASASTQQRNPTNPEAAPPDHLGLHGPIDPDLYPLHPGWRGCVPRYEHRRPCRHRRSRPPGRHIRDHGRDVHPDARYLEHARRPHPPMPLRSQEGVMADQDKEEPATDLEAKLKRGVADGSVQVVLSPPCPCDGERQLPQGRHMQQLDVHVYTMQLLPGLARPPPCGGSAADSPRRGTLWYRAVFYTKQVLTSCTRRRARPRFGSGRVTDVYHYVATAEQSDARALSVDDAAERLLALAVGQSELVQVGARTVRWERVTPVPKIRPPESILPWPQML